ncbi:hypothetical protein HPG69_001777, partial [Diceros bicornis minor]
FRKPLSSTAFFCNTWWVISVSSGSWSLVAWAGSRVPRREYWRKPDWKNSVISGCITRRAIGFRTRLKAEVIGCGGFAVFSVQSIIT